VPGRLPDPGPGAQDRIRRLQTEPLPRAVQGPADEDDVVGPGSDLTSDAGVPDPAPARPLPHGAPAPAADPDSDPVPLPAADADPAPGSPRDPRPADGPA
jgi:hypothetical protein